MNNMSKMEEMELKNAYRERFGELWNHLKRTEVTNQFAGQFYITQQEFVENNDISSLYKSAKKIGKYSLFYLILGTIINLNLKNIKFINIFRYNILVRTLIRLPLFFSPLFFGSNLINNDVLSIGLIMEKYKNRLLYFQKTGDFNYMDPDGVLFKQFVENMKAGKAM